MGKKSILIVMITIGLLMTTTLMSQDPVPGTGLEAELQVKETLEGGQEVNMRFTLRNNTPESVMVLRWYTPLEGVAGEIFDVKRDGSGVSYHGILVKRGDPLPEDYITIEAGETVSADVDLAESYDFSQAGDYDIGFRSPKVSHLVKEKSMMAKSMVELKAVKAVTIPSKKVKVKILQSSPRRVAPVADFAEAAKKTYDHCSSEKEAIVVSADTKAALIAALIPACLKSLTSSEKQQYETWFGAFDQARFNKVLDNFTKISKAFTDGNITYNCNGPKCKNSWYAYIYKGGNVEVFLCPQFWKAPESGTDTKFGVLIHEVSHEVADTNDHVYGVSGCKNLANTDPAKAIDNADSHEYFSETFKCSGADYLLYSLLLIFAVILFEGLRRYRRARTVNE